MSWINWIIEKDLPNVKATIRPINEHQTMKPANHLSIMMYISVHTRAPNKNIKIVDQVFIKSLTTFWPSWNTLIVTISLAKQRIESNFPTKCLKWKKFEHYRTIYFQSFDQVKQILLDSRFEEKISVLRLVLRTS